MRAHELLKEYRIYNKSELDKFLDQYVSKLENETAKWFFNKKARKLIANNEKYLTKPDIDPNTDMDTTNLMSFREDRQLKQQLDHIFDFLRDPELPNEYLKKVTGIQSIEQAYELADKYFSWKNKQKSEEEDWSGMEKVMSFSNGFGIYRLKSKKCLDREGKLMSHCVGSYADEVEQDDIIVLSLRDKNNEPHATIGIRENEIVELKGKGNEPVVEKYRKYIRTFLNKTNYEIDIEELLNNGMIKVNNEIYDYNNLPDNLKVKRDLFLDYTDIQTLPDNLKVGGNMSLSYTNYIQSLPENLEVGLNLYLDNSKIQTIPKNLKVGKALFLDYTDISTLPKGFKVGEFISVENTNIDTLPEGLEVGILKANNLGIKTIPKNLKVDKLVIQNTPLAEKYSEEEIRKMIENKGGNVKNIII